MSCPLCLPALLSTPTSSHASRPPSLLPRAGLFPSFPTRTPLPGPTPLTSRSHDEGVIFPPEAAKAKAGHCILRCRHSSLFRKISWRGEQDCGRGVSFWVPRYAITGEMGGAAWGGAASEIAPLFSSPSNLSATAIVPD